MIATIRGIVFSKTPGHVIIEAGGVGYSISIPFSTFKALSEQGCEEKLLIHTIHKEDSFCLYGFKCQEEKELFEMLLSVQGIGPKIALLILSHTTVPAFKTAIRKQDATMLTAINGIGKKKAEKLIFELREKIKDYYGEGGTLSDIDKNAIEALISLGYSRGEVMKILPSIKSRGSLEDFIKEALGKLS